MVVFDVDKRLQQQTSCIAAGVAGLDVALQALCLGRGWSGMWVNLVAIPLFVVGLVTGLASLVTKMWRHKGALHAGAST